jgi:hypothetical protein
MNKVSREYLPDYENQRYQELSRQFAEKQKVFLIAERSKDPDLTEKLAKEKKSLLIELRMINPKLNLSDLERSFKEEADSETKDLHQSLNNRKQSTDAN